MADYYTQCSVVIKYETEEQRAWLGQALEKANGLRCIRCGEGDLIRRTRRCQLRGATV